MFKYSKSGYIQKLLYDQKYILTVIFLFCILFQYLWVWLLFESDIGGFVDNYAKLLPQSIRNILGLKVGSEMFNVQILAFGYAHPIIIISLAFLPISIPARYISGEIENKTFDILLSKPINRWVIPTHLFLFMVISTNLLFAGMLLGTYLGSICFDLPVNLITHIKICLMGIFFYSSMAAISLAIASMSRERGKALSRIISLVVVLYFYDTIIRMAESLEYLTAYNYFQLYQPTKFVLGEVSLSLSILISMAITIIFFAFAIAKFNRRDL